MKTSALSSSVRFSPTLTALAIAVAVAVAGTRNVTAAETAAAPSAAARMSEPGPEAQQLEALTGTWNVTMTFRPSPTAEPIVTTGLRAERRMVGLYLEEVMQPAPGTKAPDFRRIAYLTYSRVEGRWQYVSLDTRFPVGIMPAYSFGKGMARELTLHFEPLAFVGMGEQVEGRMVRSNFIITRENKNREVARQFWITSDGTEQEWLAVEYVYTRKED
jgi:hypothetical protein